MTVKAFLVKAKGFIDTPETWTQGYYAHDKDGNMCEAFDEEATCFCSVGALYKANGGYYPSDEFNEAEKILNSLADRHFIVDHNDSNTHENVMDLWDRAIKQAEKVCHEPTT